MNDELAMQELRAALGCAEDRSIHDLAKVALSLRKTVAQVDELAAFRLNVRKMHAYVSENQETVTVPHINLGLYTLLNGLPLELPDLPLSHD